MDIVAATQANTKQASAELAHLVKHLGDLNQEEWQTTSACEGWTVRQVVNHIVGASDFFRPMVENALAGREQPQFNPAEREAIGAKVAAYSDQEILRQLAEQTNALTQIFENATAEQLSTPIPFFGTHVPLAFLAAIRLTELTIHGWDIYSAKDPAARLDSQSAKLLLPMPGLLRTLPRFIKTEQAAGLTEKYQFNVADSAVSPLVIEFTAGEAAPRISGGDSATAAQAEDSSIVVEMSEEQFLRLMWGRLNLAQELELGFVRYHAGEAALDDASTHNKVMLLTRIFKGL